MNLAARNLLFTLVVPGLGAVAVPWWILARGGVSGQLGWFGIVVIAVGVAIYVACVRGFAVVGRGTPGPWDPPRQLVTVGLYQWVRNPIYVGCWWSSARRSCSIHHPCWCMRSRW